VGNYVIAGRGDVSSEVLAEGLLDLGRDTHFYVPWVGSQNTVPTEGMKKVYDFLVDHEATFTLIAKDRNAVHPSLLSACVVVKESGNSSPELNFDNVPPDATALVLWSDEFPQHSEGLVCDYFDRGHQLLDLTNGLVPIVVESEATTPPTLGTDSPALKDAMPPLTEEDIVSMPEGVRKQLDRSLGNAAVDELPNPVEDDEVEAKILQFVNREEKTDESQFATLVVVLPTGRSFTTAVPLLNLWDLLNATAWEE
jgi:hypothetical protein